jgi:hypothetical protein
MESVKSNPMTRRVITLQVVETTSIGGDCSDMFKRLPTPPKTINIQRQMFEPQARPTTKATNSSDPDNEYVVSVSDGNNPSRTRIARPST